MDPRQIDDRLFVSPQLALADLREAQRAYEANAKVLDASSSMQQFLNQTV